jgi:hypothetical protein
MNNYKMNTNNEFRCRKNQLWNILKYCLAIWLAELRKSMKNLRASDFPTEDQEKGLLNFK